VTHLRIPSWYTCASPSPSPSPTCSIVLFPSALLCSSFHLVSSLLPPQSFLSNKNSSLCVLRCHLHSILSTQVDPVQLSTYYFIVYLHLAHFQVCTRLIGIPVTGWNSTLPSFERLSHNYTGGEVEDCILEIWRPGEPISHRFPSFRQDVSTLSYIINSLITGCFVGRCSGRPDFEDLRVQHLPLERQHYRSECGCRV
jgi:hypothetical protein